MSINDATMWDWWLLLTDKLPSKSSPKAGHPMDAKRLWRLRSSANSTAPLKPLRLRTTGSSDSLNARLQTRQK